MPILPFIKCAIKSVGGLASWTLTESGQFSYSSAYRAMHHTGLISSTYKNLWKIRAPMKVRIFIWLMLDDKILTQQVMHYRGWPVPTGCHLCAADIIESRDHLMWDCPYASSFWVGLMAQCNIPNNGNSNILALWIRINSAQTQTRRHEWRVAWAARAWTLWRERNRRLFTNK